MQFLRLTTQRTVRMVSQGSIQSRTTSAISRTAQKGSGDDNASDDTVEIEFRIQPLPRHGESMDHKRARLLYQSRKRGILETDLLLSRFARSYLQDMDEEMLEEYDKFLDEYDWDIYYWVTDNPRSPVPDRWKDSKVLCMLKEQVKNQEKGTMRMPDL
ncbi:Flavinator of succinate dehydrogenase-domain-containing protein [Dipodascopsis uninucleata]